MTVAAGTGALEATQQQVLTQLQSGSTGSVTVNDPNTSSQKMTVNADGSINDNASLYGYNSGGPGGGALDHIRTIQGKGTNSLAISSATQGTNSITLSSSAPSSLLAGMLVQLTGGIQESVYVQAVSGTTVTLTSNMVNAGHTALVYDIFATNGPGATAVTPIGVLSAANIYYDASTGNYYVNRADTNGNQFVRGNFTEQASLSAGSLNADLVPSTDVSAYKWWSLHVNSNAYSGTLTFQGSNDGTNFVSILAGLSQNNAALVNSTSSTNTLFFGPISFRYLRVRMTSYASGAAQGTLELYTVPPSNMMVGAVAFQNGTWNVGLSAGSNNVGGVELIDSAGTNKATISAGGAVKVDGSAVNQPVQSGFTEQASLSAGSLNADLVASTDVSAYKWWSLHVGSSAYSGTLTFQCSNDGVNFVSTLAGLSSNNAALVNSTTATSTLFFGPVTFRYLRVRMTSYSSGTAQGTLELYTMPPANMMVGTVAFQNGTWTMQPGNTPNTNPWLFMPNGCATATIAAGATGPTVIKASAGIYYGTLITSSAAGAPLGYNNASAASGTILCAIAASAPVGTRDIAPSVGQQFSAGLTFAGGATMPGMTIFYS